jgi:5-aminolevulinate synthase
LTGRRNVSKTRIHWVCQFFLSWTCCLAGVFDYDGLFGSKLQEKKEDNSYRVFKTVQRLAQDYPKAENYFTSADGQIREMKEVTIWCANDYLGMSRHPDVLQAARYIKI